MTRTSIVAALLLALAGPASARKAVAILPPAAGDADGTALALVMQSRASELLVATGRYQDLHAKQILRVAERERVAPPEAIARRLGAERAVAASLARAGGGWTLDGAPLPAALPQMIDAGALALARRVAPDVAAPARPLTQSAPALAAYATCHAILIRQPIAVEAPVVIERAELDRAIADCRSAVAADAAFVDARAALGLALALSGKDDEAVQALVAVDEKDRYLPLYWIARYWLVTRYQSPDAGATALRAAIQRHPYFLLAYGYLAEHEHALRHDEAALAAWQRYRAELPENNFIRGRISRSLARLGRTQEALAEAKAALDRDPSDSEGVFELAGREIDAGDLDRALALLQPIGEDVGGRAEVLLRIGYAYTKKGDDATAEKWLTRAEAAAHRPSEWRTRARARNDLAALRAKRGVTPARAEAVVPPAEATPFFVGPDGDVVIHRPAPPAPKMFEVLRF